MNQFGAALHEARLARAAPRESIHTLNGGTGPTLRILEHPGRHIGAHIWPGGEILLEYLLGPGRGLLQRAGARTNKDSCFDRLNILELGAGVGLLGISLAGSKLASGARIIVTDRDISGLLQKNCDRNRAAIAANGGASCTALHLDWTHSVLPESINSDCPVDLVLGADVLYNSDTARPLFETISRLIPPENTRSTFILCYKRRDTAAESQFFQLLNDPTQHTPFLCAPVQTIGEHYTIYSIRRQPS